MPDDYRHFTMANREVPPRQEVLDWCQQFHNGIAATDIAKMFGVSRATVYWYPADDGVA